MNPVLKKLSNPRLSRFEVANLLQKHVGDGSNEHHCAQACSALRRIRNEDQSAVVRVLVRLVQADGTNCQAIQAAIANLRSEAWESL